MQEVRTSTRDVLGMKKRRLSGASQVTMGCFCGTISRRFFFFCCTELIIFVCEITVQMGGVVFFFGRIADLIAQNTQAFHMVMDALLMVLYFFLLLLCIMSRFKFSL